MRKQLHAVPDAPVQSMSPFDEWGRLTRFLESARLAFARERALWTSLGIENTEHVRIAAPEGNYNVALHKHIDAIDDAEMLYRSVLVHYYALAESAAFERLRIDSRNPIGIEEWGSQLLNSNDRDWRDVQGGREGAIEVAVVRNAIAHGARTIDAAAHKRLFGAAALTRPVDSPVTLTYAELREFRSRLRSLLNVSGIGQ